VRLGLLLLTASLAAAPAVAAPIPAPPGEPVEPVRVTGLFAGPKVKPDTVADTTFYITNRARKGGTLQKALADSLEFGLVVVRFTQLSSTALADQLLRPLSSKIVDSVRMSRAEFIRALRDADEHGAATGDGAVLYVHGYATSFRRGLSQASEIMRRGRLDGPVIVFSWPANRALAKWPKPGALISGAYREDSATAVASQPALRDAITTVLSATRPGTLTLLGHSMGAQLLAEALRQPSSVRTSLSADPARAIIFFAADIAASRFRDSLALPVVTLAQRRVIYAANNDRMLSISRMVNHGPRVGQASAARALGAEDIEVVDVTSGIRANGFWRSLVDPHHGMRFAGSALYDFFGVIRGMPASCRVANGIAAEVGERVWRLVNAPLPQTLGSCSTNPTASR
jgi:esterase/lipase superfamily enzyme